MKNINLLKLIFVCGLLAFSSCFTIEPVTVKSVDDFKIKTLAPQPSVSFNVVINNPNPVGVTLKEYKSEAFLGDKKIADIFVVKNSHLAANSDSKIPIETTPSLNEIAAMMLAGAAPKMVRVKGYVTVGKFIFKKTFPFDVKENF